MVLIYCDDHSSLSDGATEHDLAAHVANALHLLNPAYVSFFANYFLP